MTAAKTAVRHLTVADLAERLGTTKEAVYHLNRRGQGPRILRRNGSKRGPVLYRETDVEKWEKTRLGPEPTP